MTFREERKGGEELLEFEFDELPDEGVEEAKKSIAPDDQIIELTDIVEKGDEARSVEGSIGISEERIEAIITRVVEDVVERVTRETMTRVAERLLKEAIDGLRQSLELPPE